MEDGRRVVVLFYRPTFNSLLAVFWPAFIPFLRRVKFLALLGRHTVLVGGACDRFVRFYRATIL